MKFVSCVARGPVREKDGTSNQRFWLRVHFVSVGECGNNKHLTMQPSLQQSALINTSNSNYVLFKLRTNNRRCQCVVWHFLISLWIFMRWSNNACYSSLCCFCVCVCCIAVSVLPSRIVSCPTSTKLLFQSEKLLLLFLLGWRCLTDWLGPPPLSKKFKGTDCAFLCGFPYGVVSSVQIHALLRERWTGAVNWPEDWMWRWCHCPIWSSCDELATCPGCTWGRFQPGCPYSS